MLARCVFHTHASFALRVVHEGGEDWVMCGHLELELDEHEIGAGNVHREGRFTDLAQGRFGATHIGGVEREVELQLLAGQGGHDVCQAGVISMVTDVVHSASMVCGWFFGQQHIIIL